MKKVRLQQNEFDMGAYKKWVKENNKVDNDVAKLEWLATVAKQKDAVELWKGYKKGEISEEDFSFQEVELNHTPEQMEAFKEIFKNVAHMVEFPVEKEFKNGDIFADVPLEELDLIITTTEGAWGEEIMGILSSVILKAKYSTMKALKEKANSDKKGE